MYADIKGSLTAIAKGTLFLCKMVLCGVENADGREILIVFIHEVYLTDLALDRKSVKCGLLWPFSAYI